MSLAERRGKVLQSSMDNLSLGTKTGKAPSKEPVADSWEDEDASSSGSDTETEGPSIRSSMPRPPPPTPSSPTYKNQVEFENPYVVKDDSAWKRGLAVDERRQEKQTATASRLIAGALGVKAPKRTEEQRAYDKAVREREQRKKDQERADRQKEAEEKEKAKDAIWED